MPNQLKNLKITSTDLVDAGANPDAHIRLFKRDENGLLQKVVNVIAGVFGKGEAVAKEAETFRDIKDAQALRELLRELSGEAWNYCYTLSDSLCSIILDDDLGEDGKRDKMFQSLDEFAEVMRNAITQWAAAKSASETEPVEKSEAQEAAFGELFAKYVELPGVTGDNEGGEVSPVVVEKSIQVEEEFNTMNIDKSKLTPEELAALEAIEKKYGEAAALEEPPVADPVPAELHPEVKKALDENRAMAARMEEMQKSLEIKDLSISATKYEVLGKKANELAPKLYDLKKAGGTVYDDYVALLDEQLTIVEKSALFGEIGSGRGMAGGNELDAVVAEIRKNNPTMNQAEALVKAY